MHFASRLRRTSSVAIVALLLCSAADAQPAALTRSIDPARSHAQFAIQHIFVDRVVGTVPIVDGTVELSPGDPVPTRVSAELDATRITTDEPDRDVSLESADYFDVKLYPRWSFVSTRLTASGPHAFAMDGLLTMHGVTRPEHLAVTVSGDDAHPVYHATGSVDRHAFGMKGARLDPVIGPTADITLDITLK